MSNEPTNVNELTPEQHKARHLHLHHCLDELFADYIEHHPDQHGFLNMPLIWLINWSHEQSQNPTERRKL